MAWELQLLVAPPAWPTLATSTSRTSGQSLLPRAAGCFTVGTNRSGKGGWATAHRLWRYPPCREQQELGEEADPLWGEPGGSWTRGPSLSREGFVTRAPVRGCCPWKRQFNLGKPLGEERGHKDAGRVLLPGHALRRLCEQQPWSYVHMCVPHKGTHLLTCVHT